MTSRVTPTPRPAARRSGASPSTGVEELLAGLGEGRFLLSHNATRPYQWELRLEGPRHRLAWTLPQGLPWGQGESRQALPAAQESLSAQGAARWDEGRWRAQDPTGDATVVLLEGRRVRGRYALGPASAGAWSLRRLDPPSVRPMPERVLPMLAHAASYPTDPETWAFEPKWDGVRTLAYVENGRVRLRSRTLLDVSTQYPEVQGLAEALPRRQAVLDGEIVALDPSGRASFERIQQRLGVTQRAIAAARAERTPIVYMAFDLLYLDGHDTTGLPYEERRGLLESLGLEGPHWRVSPSRVGDGRGLLEDPMLEGVVAKRLGSAYEPGARSKAWIKVKVQKRQELVIGGWTPGRGARKGRIGALLVGHYDVSPAEAAQRGEPPRFLYAGSVGTGFSERVLKDLLARMEPDRRAASPFANAVDKKDAVFVEPRLVAEFEFTEWTSQGRLRHPSFKGLRFDKDPRDVTREERG
jgi:bifunctional non-homologous end joining protein LigD